MKKNWTAYTVFIFTLLKQFNKTSLNTLLITVTLYMICGIAGNGGVPRVSANEGVDPGISENEGVDPGVSANEGIVPGDSADEGIYPGISADEGIDPGDSAEEMSEGQMGGIIRSANHPCAKVIKLQPTSESSWKVQCNSGNFYIRRNTDGQFSVSTYN